MLRDPILADRAAVRTILRQNMALRERETLAGMTPEQGLTGIVAVAP